MASEYQRYALVPPDNTGIHEAYYKISIQGTGKDAVAVEGQMSKDFQFQLNAQWQELIGGSIPGVETLKKLGQTGMTTGVLSQKYYAGGGYISFPLEFRVFEDGTGNVAKHTKALAKFLVADSGGITASEALNKAAAQAVKGVMNPIDTIKNAFGSMWARTVKLSIGNFFSSSGMIITSLDTTWSRMLTKTGPLYADFSLTLESLQAVHRDSGQFGIDAMIGSGISRVNMSDNEPTENTGE